MSEPEKFMATEISRPDDEKRREYETATCKDNKFQK